MVDARAAILKENTLVGGYRLLGLLGKGGMGAVYRAEQISIGREVALKVLHPSRMRKAGAVDEFLKEARHCASLHHRGIVPIHEAGYDNNIQLAYYSMAYVHGRTLFTYVTQQQGIAEDQALNFALAMAQALGHAHEHGLIHRDIKPENVLIDQSGNCLLTDLGLALDLVGSQTRKNRRRALSIVGTPEYGSPEQLRNPARACPASDVFSLGGVLHFMLTNRIPYDGETVIDLIGNVLLTDPQALTLCSPAMQDLIRLLMDKEAERRPANGYQAANIIKEFQAGLTTRRISNHSQTRRRVRRGRRR